MRVVPHFYFPNGTEITSGVSASPSSALYTNGMALSLLATRGQFYLTASRFISGDILVQVVATGMLANEYNTASTVVTILASSNGPLPSPNLVSAVFGNNGASFAIGFDTETDQAGIVANYWPCGQLFTFPGSNYTTCSWSDSSTVTGKFGVIDTTKPYLSPGHSLAILGGRLRATCAVPGRPRCQLNLATNATTVTVAPPTTALIPSIILVMPTQIGGCADLTLDLSATTGSGGRQWSNVVWQVTTSLLSIPGTSLQQYLKHHFDNSSWTVTVPRAQLASITYSISITLTNFLGGSASTLKSVVVNPDRDQPTPVIYGDSSLTVTSDAVLTLVGGAQLSPCASSNIIAYVWSVYNASGIVYTLSVHYHRIYLYVACCVLILIPC